jgi:heparan-alpha-glucosaminide N-acetyltransferase
MRPFTQRLASIDVFRALTMLLMIFVNDLWTLKDIPQWLEHTQANEDGMGLADTVFPAFLFIVGLSIPFAIGNRWAKGASQSNILGHILIRSFALLVMGFFHVNLENYNHEAAILPKTVWEILLTVSFFFIWLDYPSSFSERKKIILQGIGTALLVFLAAVYKGEENGHTVWLHPQWWGILGLIGWSYLLSALVFQFSKGRLSILIGGFLFFTLFNIATKAGWLHVLGPIRHYIWIVGDGSLPALTMAGIIIAVLYSSLAEKRQYNKCYMLFLLLGVGMLAGGFVIRPLGGGISKIHATPSWVAICTGISILFFMGLIWLVDRKKKQQWFEIIKPAGTSTLTAYLLPYIFYPLVHIAGLSLPAFLLTGAVGLVKTLVFALLIIVLTGLLSKWRIRLKI